MDRWEGSVLIGKFLTPRFAPASLSSEGTWSNINAVWENEQQNLHSPDFDNFGRFWQFWQLWQYLMIVIFAAWELLWTCWYFRKLITLIHNNQFRVWRIYSNIQIFDYICHKYLFRHSFVSIFRYEYIRTIVRVKFECTNIFGYSFVSVLECKNFLNLRIYSNIHTIFNTNIYSDIRSCQICCTNIFGYSFV